MALAPRQLYSAGRILAKARRSPQNQQCVANSETPLSFAAFPRDVPSTEPNDAA